MRFSERQGYVAPRSAIQVELMDPALRTALWNAYASVFVGKNASAWSLKGYVTPLYQSLWTYFFKQPVDDIPNHTSDTETQIRQWFFSAEWFAAYDFVEFVAGAASGNWSQQFINGVAEALEREKAGYRLSQNRIVPISDVVELAAIEEALTEDATSPLAGAREHLVAALALLSDRRTPDYRNSIKESISAVESVARVVSGDDRAELGKALKRIEQTVELHGAFRSALTSLYGYTSDEGGIRHAMLEIPSVDFADAKFMLVACSGFVSFLVAKALKAGVRL